MRDGLHICHRSGRCTQTETTVAGSQYRGIIVAPHEDIGCKSRIQNHHNGLYGKNHGYRPGQTGQLPQFQVQQRHCQEKRKRSIAEHIDCAVKHIDLECGGQNIADDYACKQTPYEFGQVEQIFFVEAVHNLGKCQTRGKHGKRFNSRFRRNQTGTFCLLEHIVHIVVLSLFCVFNRFAAHFVDQAACNRSADQTAEHQAEGCRSHTQTGCTDQTVFGFKIRPACTRRTVSARQRNRAGNQANQRIQT